MKTYFKDYDYKELLFKYYKKLWELDALRATKLLTETFNKALDEIAKDNKYTIESGFHIQIERLDQIGDKFDRDITETLVEGICKAGRAVIEKQPDKVDELFDYLEGLNKTIFERILMYLLRFTPAKTQKKRISTIIGNRKFLERPYCRYEYRLLLRDKFEEIAPEAKEVFTSWLEEQRLDDKEKKDISNWIKEHEEREATEKDFEQIENSELARGLYLVRKQFAELYDKYKNKAGATDEELAPKPMIGEARAIDPTEGSPKSVEEMVKMEPIDVLEYLNDPSKWKIDKKRVSPFHTPEKGLEGTFEKVVQKRVKDYGDGAWNALREKKVEEGSLVSFLERANCVIDKQRGNQDYEGVFRSIIYIIGGIFEDERLKKKLVKENGETIWRIIETLTRYDDKEDLTDYVRDPHQGCINCVPGEAFTLVVRFGLRCKNEDRKSYERKWSYKIIEILKYVIEDVEDPRVRSVLGVWFPQLHWMEEEWISENIDRIFGGDNDERWDGIWGSYMSWGRPYEEVFKFLASRGKYVEAIGRIGIVGKYKYDKNPDEGLVEHLMIGFFNSWIWLDCDLLKNFFGKASAELRGKAARFLTTGFKTVNEEGGKRKEEVAKKMKEYWEKRLEVIEQNKKNNFEEAVEFTGWVEDSLLESKKTLELLERTMDLTGGKLGRMRDARDFLECVCELGQGNELLALRCLRKAVVDKDIRTVLTLRGNRLVEFLEQIVQLPNDYTDVDCIRREAVDVADAYGRILPDMFRKVWEKLQEGHRDDKDWI
jgi:hypothetical protein